MAPDASTSRLLAAGTLTPAGLFFTTPPVSADRLPASPDAVFVVHVAVERGGFRVGGRPVPPRMLGKAIKNCPGWNGRPVVVVLVGSDGIASPNDTLLSALSATLDVPVLSSEAAVYLGTHVLITGGSFLRHDPPGRRSGASAIVRVGPVLPPRARPDRTVSRVPADPGPARPAPSMADADAGVSQPVVSSPTRATVPVPEVETAEPVTVDVVTRQQSSADPVMMRSTAQIPESPVSTAAAPVRRAAAKHRRSDESNVAVGDVSIPADVMVPGSIRVPGSAQVVDRATDRDPESGATGSGGETGFTPLRPGFANSGPMPVPSVTVPAAAGSAAAGSAAPERADPQAQVDPEAEVDPQAQAEVHPQADVHAQGEVHARADVHAQREVVVPPAVTAVAPGRHLLRPAAELHLPAISVADQLPRPAEPDTAEAVTQDAVEDAADATMADRSATDPTTSEQAATGSAAPATEAAGAPWIQVTPSATREDRERLRSLLGWRYEAHARAVTGMLALQPGLRAAGGGDDLLAGLVAVRAHLSNTAEQVDAALRAGPRTTPFAASPADTGVTIDASGAELLARCTASGLSRLPVVVGAVFRPGSPDSDVLARYWTGLTIVEPAFTEASLDRFVTPESTVEYAIWSSTGRRTDRLDGGDAGPRSTQTRVLFGAGARFRVLGVEKPGDTGRIRVLLREISQRSGSDERADERAKQRLLESVGRLMTTELTGPPTAQWRDPLGIRQDAVTFALGEH